MLNEYSDLLAIAEAEAANAGVDVNTALKEILHYDILFALSESQICDHMVFQGGTALRLCHKGNRYSEDLDFVAGNGDVEDHINSFKRILVKVIANRYGLEVRFKDPGPKRFDGKEVSVRRWTAVINVDRNNPSEQHAHKIKIEVANVPSRQNEAMFIQHQYHGLAPGYSHILMRTSTLREIMADKVVAAANRPILKPRDVWDLEWLSQRMVPVDLKMVKLKLEDYFEHGTFDRALEERIAILRSPEYLAPFKDEMTRFVGAPVRKVMNESADFVPRMLSRVATNLERVYLGRKNNIQELDPHFEDKYTP